MLGAVNVMSRFLNGLARPRKFREVPVEMEWVEIDPVAGLPAGAGIYVDPADPHIGKCVSTWHYYEHHIVEGIRNVLPKGGTLLDIGANIGYHTLAAARHVGPRGRVISVEMSPINCTLLLASVQRNGLKNVTLFPNAVAEQAGWLSFCVSPHSSNGMLVNDYLRERIAAEPERYGEEIPIPALPIDSFISARLPIDAIKMDIEGSEIRAVQGMRKLFARQRPYVLFEFHPNMIRDIGGRPATELLDFFRGYGYRIHQIQSAGNFDGPDLSNDGVMDLCRNEEGILELKDLMAVPTRV